MDNHKEYIALKYARDMCGQSRCGHSTFVPCKECHDTNVQDPDNCYRKLFMAAAYEDAYRAAVGEILDWLESSVYLTEAQLDEYYWKFMEPAGISRDACYTAEQKEARKDLGELLRADMIKVMKGEE